jgi:hypothetical protein
MMDNPKSPRESTKLLLEVIGEFTNVARYQIKRSGHIAFLCTTSMNWKNGRKIPFTLAIKM